MPLDLDAMARLSATLKVEYRTDAPDPWSCSPFEWIHNEAAARKGAIGKEMFRRWCRAEGLDVSPAPPGVPGDCVVAGLKIVVKFGLLWAQGTFTFEQIRLQPYDATALLGLEPQRVHLWVVPRDELWAGSREQHGPDTHWLRFRPGHAPSVLRPFGGTLAAARASLLEQAGGQLGS